MSRRRSPSHRSTHATSSDHTHSTSLPPSLDAWHTLLHHYSDHLDAIQHKMERWNRKRETRRARSRERATSRERARSQERQETRQHNNQQQTYQPRQSHPSAPAPSHHVPFVWKPVSSHSTNNTVSSHRTSRTRIASPSSSSSDSSPPPRRRRSKPRVVVRVTSVSPQKRNIASPAHHARASHTSPTHRPSTAYHTRTSPARTSTSYHTRTSPSKSPSKYTYTLTTHRQHATKQLHTPHGDVNLSWDV